MSSISSLERWLARFSGRLRHYLPPLNFITIHYAYFILVCLITSIIFWGSSDAAFSVCYTESLFLVVSAMTEAGRARINSVIAFSFSKSQSASHPPDQSLRATKTTESEKGETRADDKRADDAEASPKDRRRPTLEDTPEEMPGSTQEFHNLSSDEPDHLSGCEYRALKVLAMLVPTYFFLWQVLASLALGAWMNNYMPDTARANGTNPWWLGIFNAVSAFNDSGMSLLDANMIPFQQAPYVLITMGLLILAGNTAYPLFLRLIIWSSLRILNLTTREDAFIDLKATLAFILKYPRRVYTNLFPSRPSWWLLFMLISLNSVDWVAFEVLNIGNSVIEKIPTGYRVLNGLFQALAVRSGGFYVIPISGLFIGLQLLYEERSLGIYSDNIDTASEIDPEVADPLLPIGSRPPTLARTTSIGAASARPSFLARRLSRSGPVIEARRAFKSTFMSFHGVAVVPPKGPGLGQNAAEQGESRVSFISHQIRGQLAHDLWWLVLAVLIITIIETSKFIQDSVTFSVFNIIFEVVSAYGTVGISVGIPTDAYSFCGAWHVGSKLVLCLIILRGRHRGLPVALDHAVRLPGRQLHRYEEEDHQIRRSRTIELER
ncbi:cation transporter [Colletotrichum limetticola]|uniref:Cation transporter n=1 Tax=Colletotrichum limetticola TaxID=1209924 RepID=A0ABQ9QCI1_9PEZI|nr:cation transporter [Colletotrichum limetticola]